MNPDEFYPWTADDDSWWAAQDDEAMPWDFLNDQMEDDRGTE